MNVSTKLQSVVQEIEKVSTLPLYENCPITHCCYRVHLRRSHVVHNMHCRHRHVLSHVCP